MKFLFWWGAPVGYFDACTRALSAAGHDVSVAFEEPSSDLPFSDLMERGFGHLAKVEFWSGRPQRSLLRSMLRETRPDVLVICSWGYVEMILETARAPARVIRLVAADTPWTATRKQYVGQFTHREVLPRVLDGAWVAGPPQRLMLTHLGFQPWQIIENLNCCDTDLYADPAPASDRFDGPFLYVGRRIPIKGIIELVEAFNRFRRDTGSERRLLVVGNGPVEPEGEGIDILPFANPSEVKKVMERAFALVHPARREHWGVVVQEAASMGLPLVLSPFMFAASRFLWPDVNGLMAGPDVKELAIAMAEMDAVALDRYEAMSSASVKLASLLDLDQWVETIERGVERIRRVRQTAGGRRGPMRLRRGVRDS